MKNICTVIVGIIMTVAMLCSEQKITYAIEYHGISVDVYIQSYDRELAWGTVEGAYTFKEALQILGGDKNVDIVFTQDGSKSSIYSVNGITNGFLPGGGWYGYIVRDGAYMRPDDYMEIILADGDELVLYYGSLSRTKIITELSVKESNGLVTFSASTIYTTRSDGDPGLEENVDAERLENVKIHLIMPGGTRRILKTNRNGTASTRVDKLGIYRYFAESYVGGSLPLAVRTKNDHFIYGISDPESVDRGEAAAFLVNLFNTPNYNGSDQFSDVQESNIYYNEIKNAAAAGIVSGYEDGSFRPHEPVNKLQLAIMLSNVYEGSTDMKGYVDGLPDWAVSVVKPSVYYDLFGGKVEDWMEAVSELTLWDVYFGTQFFHV